MAAQAIVKEMERNLIECSTTDAFSKVVGQAIKILDETKGKIKLPIHVQLCHVIIQSSNDMIAHDNVHTDLLLALGHVRALEIITKSISNAR